MPLALTAVVLAGLSSMNTTRLDAQVQAMAQQQPGGGDCQICKLNMLIARCEDAVSGGPMGHTGCINQGDYDCAEYGMFCAILPPIGVAPSTGQELILASGERVRVIPLSPGLWLSEDCHDGAARVFAASDITSANVAEIGAPSVNVLLASR